MMVWTQKQTEQFCDKKKILVSCLYYVSLLTELFQLTI
jgi:hypothetical protein